MNSASFPDPLADRLDQVLPPHSTVLPDHVEAEEPAVRVAVMLARGPHPVLSSEAVARIQTRVLGRAASLRRAPVRWNGRLLRWAAAACVALMILTVTSATASADSVPGDTLYPVKRLVEQGRLALSSNATDVSLRLDFADRRLDEFETLLNRGEVNFRSLNDALREMNSALVLVEQGDGPREEAAIRLLDLSARQMDLAVTAASRVAPDPAKTDKLRQVVDGADQVQQHAHDLITPSSEPQAALPSLAAGSRAQPHSLGPESVTFIATDILSAETPASAVPNDRPSKPNTGGGVLTGSSTPEPTVTLEPTDDPVLTPTPEDRPPAEADPDTPTPEPDTATPEPTVGTETPAPTDVPTATPTPEDRPPAEADPDTATPEPTQVTPAPTDVPALTPTPEPTAVPVTATPEPTDDPVLTLTPENRPPAEADPDTATPEPTAVPVTATPEPTDDPVLTLTPENRPPAEADPDTATTEPTAVPVTATPERTDTPVLTPAFPGDAPRLESQPG
jgi:hypothetical protein